MEMKGLNHVNIGVSDLEKSKKFYCELFGMTEVYREPHLIFLMCGRDILTLQDSYKNIEILCGEHHTKLEGRDKKLSERR